MPRVSVSLKDEELQELSRRANVAQIPLSTYLARVAREHITQIWDPLLELGAQVTTAREYRSRYKICCCGLDEWLAQFGLPPVDVYDPEASEQ